MRYTHQNILHNYFQYNGDCCADGKNPVTFQLNFHMPQDDFLIIPKYLSGNNFYLFMIFVNNAVSSRKRWMED